MKDGQGTVWMLRGQLLEDVEILASGNGREVGSVGHDQAAEHLIERLEGSGLMPYTTASFALPYSREGLGFTNIVGCLTGMDPQLAPVLLAAHYDTCGEVPGADDNAAGVAILLGIAEALQRRKRDRTVVFAFFDAEEPPHFLQPSMGSIRFYEDQRTGPVYAAIVLDLVGHDVPIPGMEDLLFITGAESDPELEAAIRQLEPETGLRTVPTLNRYVGDLSDHHIFRVNKTPYLLLTCGRWEHYHSNTDTPDNLNFDKISAIGLYVQSLAEKLCTTTLEGPFEGSETLETEIYFLEKNILPVLSDFGINMTLDSRSDIDRLIMMLMTQFDL